MKLPFDSAIPLGIYPKNPKSPIPKNLSMPMFIAALLPIAKGWKHPKCPSVNEWVKNNGAFAHGTLHNREKEESPIFCDNMDGTGEYYGKRNKPVGERQIPYDLTYKRSVMNKIN